MGFISGDKIEAEHRIESAVTALECMQHDELQQCLAQSSRTARTTPALHRYTAASAAWESGR